MHDHRKLGRELELFDSDPLIGAGLPYWLPAGAAIRHALEEFIREAERRDGYQHVYSPILASGSCTRCPGIGRTTARTCSRRWIWAASSCCYDQACARTTRSSTARASTCLLY